MRFSFLGRAVVETPEADAVEVRGVQPALVLAHLALERPRPLLRDELADLLWPVDLVEHWEGAARQVISRARRALVAAGLAPESLTSVDGVTTLDAGAPVEVDVELAMAAVTEAEKLVDDGQWSAAADLAHGARAALVRPFLPGAEARWALDWRDRISAFARRAVLASAAAALGGGRAADAVALARTALEDDPLDEPAVRALMHAYAGTGNRVAALSAYERLRQRLDDELGVRPSPVTEEAYRDLLGPAPTSPGPGTRLPEPVPGSARSLFVGRAAEVAVIEDELRGARQGAVRIVVVEGEAGIGKTRLVAEAARAAHREGVTVLWGRCDPDVGVAHGPFADIVGQVVAERPDIVARLGVVATHLSPLVPQLGSDHDDALPSAAEPATARLFRAVGAILAAAADEPLTLVIDDLQWADGDTLTLLRHVVPWLQDRPCLVVLTAREPTPEVAGALAEVQRLAPTANVRLTGLSVDAVVELLEASHLALSDDPRAVAATVTARTAGNPLYVTQLLQEATTSDGSFEPTAVPEAVSRLFERRLAALDPPLASMLVLASVAGPEFELGTLEACSTAPPDEVLGQIEDLCHRRFLVERAPGRFAFAHELVRDAVLDTTSATRRRRLHQRIGAAVAETTADPALVARHFVEAGPACVDDAVTWSLRAGEAALERAAWSSARDQFHTAARLAPSPPDRVEALIGCGRAQRALRDLEGAQSTLEEALGLARTHGLARALAAATLGLVGGGGRGVALDLDDAERTRLLRIALAGLGPDDIDLLVPVLAALAGSLWLTEAEDERRALTEQCLAAARRWGDARGLATAFEARRVALMGPAGTEARVADGRETLALSRSATPPEAVVFAHLGLVEDLLELGDRDGADVELEAATVAAAALAHPYWTWATACWRTLATIIDGCCDEAERQAFAAVEHQSSGDHPQVLAALGVNLVDIRLFQGRPGETIELLRDAADDNPHIPAYRAVLALVATEAGDEDTAWRAYGHFASGGFELPPDSNWLLAVAVLADVAATRGDRDGAERLIGLLEPWSDRHVVLNCYGGGGAYWGPVSHHLGRLEAVRGNRVEAERQLRDAIAQAESFRAPLFAARSREALAKLG